MTRTHEITLNGTLYPYVFTGYIQRAIVQQIIGAEPLVTALARITKERKDTSRDPRMAILNLLQAYGDASQADNIEGYLRDFDPAIA